MVLDKESHAHIAYGMGIDNQELKYATNESGEWKTTVIPSDSGAIVSTIALNGTNGIKIAFYFYWSQSTPCGFFEAENSTGDWAVRKLASCDNVSEINMEDYNVSLAIDHEGRIHAAYHFEGGLFYRVFDSSR